MQENNGSNNEKQSGLSWSEPAAPKAHTPAPIKTAAPEATTHTTPTPDSSSAKLIGMVVVGVMVGVVVAWGWVALRSEGGSLAMQNNGTATTTSTMGKGSDPALSIMSPQTAGKSVAIDKAIVSAPTWIVVYENKNGVAGNALGAALFFPSRQTGSVELLRSTEAGKSYLIVKQVDNGDRKFSLKGDQLLSEGGAVQWVTLEVK